MSLYVKIEDDESISKVGGLPRTFYSPSRDAVLESAKLSRKALRAEGWFDVKEDNRRKFDRDLEVEIAGEILFKRKPSARAYRRFSYAFVPNLRDALIRKIDAFAAHARSHVMTLDPGQETEYALVYDEAVEVIRRERAGIDVNPEEFPFLDGMVMKTKGSDGLPVADIGEAAKRVRDARVQVTYELAKIRSIRLEAKMKVADAATDADAYEVWRGMLLNTDMTVYAQSDETTQRFGETDPEWNTNYLRPKNA